MIVIGGLAVVVSLLAALLFCRTRVWWVPSAVVCAVAVVLLSRGDPTSRIDRDSPSADERIDAAIRGFGIGGLLGAPLLLATSWIARSRAAGAGRARS